MLIYDKPLFSGQHPLSSYLPVPQGWPLSGGKNYCPKFQRAKRVVSDSLGLVDFALGLVNSVLTCPTNSVLNLPDGFCS